MATLPAGGADVLIHEATFATHDDVETDKHSVLGDVLDLASRLNPLPLALVLCHISTRYGRGEFAARLRAQLEVRKMPFPVTILDEAVPMSGPPAEPAPRGGRGSSVSASAPSSE